MRRDKPDAQGKAPPPSSPDSDSQVDLPPWLRDDFVPESKVRRIAPVNPESSGGDPPWLADIPEVEEPRSYKIGGTEISAEYLAGGDDLPDTLDSEMTFDAWMAEQEESKRVKDIEEEVPDLLTGISEFEGDSSGAPDSKGTGQLPDWFLGLEALDTRDAPDWFVNEDIPDAQSKPPSEIPPWISDMVIEDEETSKPKAPPEDEFGSLLRSIGDSEIKDKATPDAWSFKAAEDDAGAIPDDFFAQLTAAAPERAPMRAAPPPPSAAEDDEVPSFEDLFAGLGEPDAENDLISGEPTPIDDMFAQLGSSAPPQLQPTLEDTEAVVEDFFAEIGDAPPQPSPKSWETSLPSQLAPEIDAFDEFPDDPDAPGGVEIPQIELDAFFDGVAAERTPSALDRDEIAEPDLEWFVTSEPEADEPEVIEAEPPPLPPVDREDTMGWLSELNNIVTAVQRPLQPPPPEEPVVYDTHRLNDFEVERAASETRPDVEEFEWPDPLALPEAEPAQPEPEPEPDPSDWLDAITPDDLEMLDEPPAETAPPPPRRCFPSACAKPNSNARAVDIEDQIFQLPPDDPNKCLLPAHELQSAGPG
ncbi:MAG: hypothetical protein LC121_17875 [Anaerolineae bacterium]|nr:hypothetical protein [Anaerolineae bacterium]